jgi:hypothetical protein
MTPCRRWSDWHLCHLLGATSRAFWFLLRIVSMARRFRLFVKKRGQRRTGSRWWGSVTVAAIDSLLLFLGLLGVYWLTTRVIFAEDSSHAWWLWLTLLIPLALVAYGATELARLAWTSAASRERRAATQKSISWERLGIDLKSRRPDLPTVPPIDAVIDSPGVKLACRLPIDGAPGRLSLALAVVSIVWIFLIDFLYNVIRLHLGGKPIWLITWLLVPFVLAGAWTVIALVRQILMTTGIGATRLEISSHPLFPGREYEAFVSQAGRASVRWFQIHLVCDEHSTYHQGTDTRTATAVVYRETVFGQRNFDIAPESVFEASFRFRVPASAMHSFAASHNAVSWALVVRGRMARWPEFERRFPLYVYPDNVAGKFPGLATVRPEAVPV